MNKPSFNKLDNDVSIVVTQSETSSLNSEKIKNNDRTRSNLIIHKGDLKNGYTKIDSRFLRSKELSLKAKCLMCMVLSFPPDWNFSISGLVSICKEGETSIKSGLEELKKKGYLKVKKLNPDKSQRCHFEYIYEFYECSEKGTLNGTDAYDNSFNKSGKDLCSGVYDDSKYAKQGPEILPLEAAPVEAQAIGNKAQLINENKNNINIRLDDSLSINQSAVSSKTPADKTDVGSMSEYSLELEECIDLVKRNVDFESFVDWLGNEDKALEYVRIIAMKICSRKSTEHICNEIYPMDIVKSALLKVDIDILQEAIEVLSHQDDLHHIDKYFISVLFNLVNTKNTKSDYDEKWAEYAFKRDFGKCYD